MPLAVVRGKAITELPKDLYIPPDALEVILEAFEGPLDLLLYLVRRQNLDILEINVAEITRQYMEYIEMMRALSLELAAEYLVMAALLAEIKSRMLLPRQAEAEEEEEDPRAELVRRLLEYERYKKAAEALDSLPRMERDLFPARAEPPAPRGGRPEPVVELRELLLAFAGVIRRAELRSAHRVHLEPLSTRERMSDILAALEARRLLPFTALFPRREGRAGVVVTFLALLELVKEALVELVQGEPGGLLHVRARAA
ncbi:MAG: segregation and condensation protein A [Porticoccaceae bacterium]|nr:MAG: segregation and condensation protein A [Porticoccaceae bacterium]